MKMLWAQQRTVWVAIHLLVLALVGLSDARSEPSPTVIAGADNRWAKPPAPDCATSKTLVKLASAEVAEAVGLEFAQVSEEPLQRTLERNVELTYNANRYVRVSSRVAGVIAQVPHDLGKSVREGEPVLVIDSSELGSAKAALLLAIETAKLWEINARRERALVDKGIGVEREALEAETKAAESKIEASKVRQHLLNLGLSTLHLQAVEEDGDTSSLLPVRAPSDGTIVERTAVLGELVEAGRPLLSIADTKMMWAIVDLVEADLAWVKAGQKVTVQLDGLPGRDFAGMLTWISTQISEKTRTIPARVELDNADGVLRANMFGKAAILIGDGRNALTIPKDAVQWEGCCNIAFVKADEEARVFRPARLTLGFEAADRYEIVDGLRPGETIVTKGSFILKNELLKDSIGAGCCEVAHLEK